MRHRLVVLGVFCLLLGSLDTAHAGANKVALIDACEIHPVFCASGGGSDIPGFISGFAVFNAGGDPPSLTLHIKGSIPMETHRVFLCPGAINDAGGFTGCRLVGAFETNGNGHGGLHVEFVDGPPAEKVVAINVPVFATVIANCPNEPNALCAPAEPLQ